MDDPRALLIDVGNSNIKLALADPTGLRATYVLPTSHQETTDTLGLKVVDICRHMEIDAEEASAWVVSSVVPEYDTLFRLAGDKYSRAPVYFVPGDIELPLSNQYANPREVGADRLVTAYAARRLFSEPGLIVVDFGTATTVECVQNSDYLGGLICPGVHSSLRSLGGGTAKLPRIGLELDSPDLAMGDSTVTSLNHGFLFGFASMVDGLCNRVRPYLQGPVRVVATGGIASTIASICPSLETVRPDLLHRGLWYACRSIVFGESQGESLVHDSWGE